MSNDRTTVSVKRDHIALMNTLFRFDAATGKYVAQPEVFFNTPNIAVDMGNFIGALNHADSQQYPPTTPVYVPPTPDPADPLARMRAAPGQLSMWQNATSIEMDAMRAIVGYDNVSRHVGFYGPGSPGRVTVYQIGPASYNFVRFLDEGGNRYPNDEARVVPDINGAGDAYVALHARLSGMPVPRPLVP